MSQDVQEPPKKKLKQAQLLFCNSPSSDSSKLSPKISVEKKRKALDEPSEQRASKTVRKVHDAEKENLVVSDTKDTNDKSDSSHSKKTDVFKIANKNKPDAIVVSDVIVLEDPSDVDGSNLQVDLSKGNKNSPKENLVAESGEKKKSGKKPLNKSPGNVPSEKKSTRKLVGSDTKDSKITNEKSGSSHSQKTNVLKIDKNKPDAVVVSDVIVLEDSSNVDSSLKVDSSKSDKNSPKENPVAKSAEKKKSGKKTLSKSPGNLSSEKKSKGKNNARGSSVNSKGGLKKKPKLDDLLVIKPSNQSLDPSSDDKKSDDSFLDGNDLDNSGDVSDKMEGKEKKKPKLSDLFGIKPLVKSTDCEGSEHNVDTISLEGDDCDTNASETSAVNNSNHENDSKKSSRNEPDEMVSDVIILEDSIDADGPQSNNNFPKVAPVISKSGEKKSRKKSTDNTLKVKKSGGGNTAGSVKANSGQKKKLKDPDLKSPESEHSPVDGDKKTPKENPRTKSKEKKISDLGNFFYKLPPKTPTDSATSKKSAGGLSNNKDVGGDKSKSIDQNTFSDKQVDCVSISDVNSSNTKGVAPCNDQFNEPKECKKKETSTSIVACDAVDSKSSQPNTKNKSGSSETQLCKNKDEHKSDISAQKENCISEDKDDKDLKSTNDTDAKNLGTDGSNEHLSDGESSSSILSESSDDSKKNNAKEGKNDCAGTVSNISVSDSIEIVALSSDEGDDKTDKGLLKTPESSATISDLSETKSSGSHGKPTPKRKLTPKGLLRRELAMKKREEAERLKMEKKKKMQELREQKMKASAAKDEEKKHAQEERKRQKMMELEKLNEKRQKKEEEKRKREEEKRQKEEERNKKKEEKLKEEELKEEAKRLKQVKEEQKKAAFAKFFKPKSQPKVEATLASEDAPSENLECCTFMPFPVKSDMRLAAVKRRSLNDKEMEELDRYLENPVNSKEKLYLIRLKSGIHEPLFSTATWPSSSLDDQHDVIIVESMKEDAEDLEVECYKEPSKKRPYRVKLLQFHENRRPAYWGTWRKKSSVVSPLHPFNKDEKWFDYEVDSDSEWEDEEEGENIEDVDGDKESDEEPEEQAGGENGYILDNQFVPHGYLSDEEAQDREDDDTPEAQKLRLTVLKEEFDEEMKHKTERLKPRMLGLVWISNRTTEIPKGILHETLIHHRCVWDENVSSIDLYGEPLYESPTSTSSTTKGKTLAPEVEDALVKMVHGSRRSMVNLVKDFMDLAQKDYPDQKISKRLVASKIRELCSKVHNAQGKLVWSVKNELCNSYNVTSIVDTVPKLATPPATGKQKDTALQSFLSKGTSTPMKKRASLTPATTPPVVMQKTPTLVKSSGPRKKVSLITLPHTPRTERIPVHEATPHPSFKILKN